MSRFKSPSCSYLICTQQRSGSWLLAEALEATRVAGSPREYFNSVTENELFARWSISTYDAYIQHVLHTTTSSNGVFGIKIHWSQFHPMIEKLRQTPRFAHLSIGEMLREAFCPAGQTPVFIWLTRRDRVRQAISHYRAIITGKWWQIERVRPGQERGDASIRPPWDFEAIRQLEIMSRENDVAWLNLFNTLGVSPVQIYYEELAASYESTILQVLNKLGITDKKRITIAPSRLKKQADAETEEWVQKYLRQYSRQGRGPQKEAKS